MRWELYEKVDFNSVNNFFIFIYSFNITKLDDWRFIRKQFSFKKDTNER